MTALGYPAFLWLLLLVPALMVAYRYAGRRDRASRERFADPALHGVLGLGRKDRKKAAVPLLVAAALVLSVVAVARPLGEQKTDEDRAASMDVIVALDVSDSMAVADVSENRLAAAKEFVSGLVAAAPDNRYGLVLFSGDAVVTCPPTLDHDAFLTFIGDADFGRANLPGTAVGEAVLAALTRFKKSELPRAIVVVTDGENTYGADPVKAAASAKEAGVPVYTVGVGTAEGGRIPSALDFFGNVTFKRDREGRTVVSRLDESSLGSVASAGGGRYFAASGPGSTKALAAELRPKKQVKVKDPFTGAVEYGPWFSLAAFILLMAAICI